MTRWSMAFKILTILDSIKYAKVSNIFPQRNILRMNYQQYRRIYVNWCAAVQCTIPELVKEIGKRKVFTGPFHPIPVFDDTTAFTKMRSSTNMSTWLDF